MHTVKCPICNQSFDADKIAWVKYGKRRYAHESCMKKIDTLYNNNSQPTSEFDNFHARALNALANSTVNREVIMDYCHWLFKGKGQYQLIGQQLEIFIDSYHFKQAGILRTLYWYYQLTQHSKEDYTSIGIVPYIYNEAKKFFMKKSMAATEENLTKPIRSEIRKIIMPAPKRQKKIKLMFQED